MPTAKTPGYVLFRGRVACVCLAAWLPVYEQELLDLGVIKFNVDIAQLTGNYAQSGGTHGQGGAADIWQHDKVSVSTGESMGAADFERTPAQGFAYHSHLVLKGCPHNTPARYQVTAREAGYNGLGAGGRGGRDPRGTIKLRTWEQGIAWAKARQAKRRKKAAMTTAGSALKPRIVYKVTKPTAAHAGPGTGYATKGAVLKKGTKFTGTRRSGSWVMNGAGRWLPIASLAATTSAPQVRVATLNLPAPGVGIGADLGNDAGRIAAAVRILSSQSLDYIGLQELGAPKGRQVPSAFAAEFAKAMGPAWFHHVPKLAFNENNALVRKASFDTIGRPNDVIIRGTAGGKALPGKHVTPTHLNGGKAGARGIEIGNTHLMPNNPAGAAAQAVLAGRATIAAAGKRRPVLLGDFNTDAELTALAKLGLVDTLTLAANVINPGRDTYVAYKAKSPTIGKGKRYDRVFIRPDDFDVIEHKTITDAVDGAFRQPRPSDHLPVIVTLQEK